MPTRSPTKPTPRGPDPRSGVTRQRLIDVAQEVFCEQGFRTATVREICSRASANIAAVSYHFEDKEGLYRAVIAQAKCHADTDSPTRYATTKDPEADLRTFILTFGQRMFRGDACAAHGKLMAWEMIEPTSALDDLVRDVISPTWQHLAGIVARILGVSPGDARRAALVRRSTASVLSQLLLYRNCRAVVERLHPDVLCDPAEMERIAEHVTEFSLAALRGIRPGRPRSPKQIGTPRKRRAVPR